MRIEESYGPLAPDRSTSWLLALATAAFLLRILSGSWLATHAPPPTVGKALALIYGASPLIAWLLVGVAAASYLGYLHERRDAAPRR